jgi:hypothetical protein
MSHTDTERVSLRGGGRALIDGATLRVDRDDGKTTLPTEPIRRVDLRVLEWGLAVISAVAVALGVYVVAGHLLAGVAFVAVGVWSLRRTYRQRYALLVWVDDRPDPLVLYPENSEACHTDCCRSLPDRPL